MVLSQVEKRHLIYVFLIALGLRSYVFLFTPVIGTDCYTYFSLAKDFVEGQYHNINYPPLYPIFIASFSLITGEYEVAGKLVALLFGVFTVFPLYFFARSLFGHKAAVITALLLAVNPTHVRLSADLMRETTHVFFFITSIYLTWHAIEGKSWRLYALLGVSVCLDFLTRVEGGVVLLCVIIPWLLLANGESLKKNLLQRALFLFIFLAPFLVLVSPYFMTIRGSDYIYGRVYKLIASERQVVHPKADGTKAAHKKRLSEADKIHIWKEKKRYDMIFLYILHESARTLFLPYLPLLLVGFFRFSLPDSTRGSPSGFILRAFSVLTALRLRLAAVDIRKEYFVLSLLAVYSVPLFRWAITDCTVSGRYLLACVVLSLIWAGKGGEIVVEELERKISIPAAPSMDFSRYFLLFMAIIVFSALPKDLKVKRKHEISQKVAGYWIRDQYSGKLVVMGRVWKEGGKVALYAQADLTRLLLVWSYRTVVSEARRYKADYLVFYKEDMRPKVYSKIEQEGDFVFLKEWVDTDRKGKIERHLRLYRLIPEQ